MRFPGRPVIGVLMVVAFIVAPTKAQRRGPAGGPLEPQGRRGRQMSGTAERIQTRTYVFKETNQKIEYDVFVSSKINRRNESPLIIALHGHGVQPSGMLRYLTDAAEAGGYVVAAPLGYALDGWYGINAAVPAGTKPPNLAELSEKDVMNVLALMRQEFKIDDHRIYLLGQSMGGAGALYLGVKYHEIWAAVGATAPAAGALRPSILEPVTDLPFILVHGDADEAVPVQQTRAWAEKMRDLKMTYEYYEVRNGAHADAIAAGATRVFAFFDKHTKPAGSR